MIKKKQGTSITINEAQLVTVIMFTLDGNHVLNIKKSEDDKITKSLFNKYNVGIM